MDVVVIPARVAWRLASEADKSTTPRPRFGPDPVGEALEAVVDALVPPEQRRSLIGELAERRPDLVLRRATDWLTDSDTEVLIRLPEHWFRVAVAGALRPWSAASIVSVIHALQGDSGAEVVAQVMADRSPALTRPAGVTDDVPRRWHAIGGEMWEWSLWCSDDGCYALEVVASSGLVDFTVGELVERDLVDAWLREGPGALDADVARIRAQTQAPRR